MAPLLYDPIEAFELLIAIIIFHTTRRLHFLILQISGLNLIASGHYDFVNVCIILLSRIEKIHREAAEKMLFLRSKKHENQRIFGLFFGYQWYQYEFGINVCAWRAVGWKKWGHGTQTLIRAP